MLFAHEDDVRALLQAKHSAPFVDVYMSGIGSVPVIVRSPDGQGIGIGHGHGTA